MAGFLIKSGGEVASPLHRWLRGWTSEKDPNTSIQPSDQVRFYSEIKSLIVVDCGQLLGFNRQQSATIGDTSSRIFTLLNWDYPIQKRNRRLSPIVADS
uniref:Uncharacterized protein n=1 Tax=Romanomermis culicivorax TaxID=13658 RepID=A0A915K1L0_ROMCU